MSTSDAAWFLLTAFSTSVLHAHINYSQICDEQELKPTKELFFIFYKFKSISNSILTLKRVFPYKWEIKRICTTNSADDSDWKIAPFL